MKRFILSFVMMALVSAPGYAKPGTPKIMNWEIQTNAQKVFYLSHGTTEWGHAFGFFKVPGHCGNDVFWINLSARDEKVKEFEGVAAELLLTVGSREFRVTMPVLGVGAIGITNIVIFTNRNADGEMIEAFKRGKTVKVKVVEPPGLASMMTQGEEEFSLMGFTAKREEALAICEQIPGQLPEEDPAEPAGTKE